MEKLVDLELAKKLKKEGYNTPCEYFYQYKNLPYSSAGLKRTKNGEIINHNQYDDFIYSAPTLKNGGEYLIGKKHLEFINIKPQMLVKDIEGNIGKITDIEHDIHNVEVEYLQGGLGLYCLDETCNEFDPLYIIIK